MRRVSPHREAGTKRGIVKSLAGLATLAVACQQLERAARLFGAAFALRDNLGCFGLPERAIARAIRDARTAVDASTFAAAWTTGRAMTRDQAVAETIEMLAALEPPGPRARGADAGTTMREREVLRLIASG